MSVLTIPVWVLPIWFPQRGFQDLARAGVLCDESADVNSFHSVIRGHAPAGDGGPSSCANIPTRRSSPAGITASSNSSAFPGNAFKIRE
jgi:hypothetical protein